MKTLFHETVSSIGKGPQPDNVVSHSGGKTLTNIPEHLGFELGWGLNQGFESATTHIPTAKSDYYFE